MSKSFSALDSAYLARTERDAEMYGRALGALAEARRLVKDTLYWAVYVKRHGAEAAQAARAGQMAIIERATEALALYEPPPGAKGKENV